MSTNQESSGSSELHLAVAAINTPLQSSPGEESHVSNMHGSLVRRPRDDHRNANRRSRSLGPYQSSEGASDLSGLEAGRYELDDEENLITRRGRFQDLSGLGQGSRVQQIATFVDARSIQVGIPPEVAHQAASQFADSVRSATIAEAEIRHTKAIEEAHRVSSQSARQHAIAEAEVRHQQVIQDLSRSSLEQAQSMSNQVADQVRRETVAEAEARHEAILRDTIEQVERRHSQVSNEVATQRNPGDQVTIRELQSQLLCLSRQNQELQARLSAAESSGSVRAPYAAGEGQGGSDKQSHAEMFDLFSDEPVPNPPDSVSSINQVLAVLQEEVQNLRDVVGRKSKKGKKQNDSSDSSDSESSSQSDHEFAVERKLMRLKGYDKIKVPQLPKSAAEMRGWKNSLTSQIVACCKGSEKELLSWLSNPLEGVELPSEKFPVLNRILGSKLLEAAKGGRFGVDFQALQERSVRQGMQVQGHLLLGRICKKFRLDKERGMSLSQQHLLGLKPQGVEIKDLEVFRDRVEFVLSSLETSEYPNEA